MKNIQVNKNFKNDIDSDSQGFIIHSYKFDNFISPHSNFCKEKQYKFS